MAGMFKNRSDFFKISALVVVLLDGSYVGEAKPSKPVTRHGRSHSSIRSFLRKEGDLGSSSTQLRGHPQQENDLQSYGTAAKQSSELDGEEDLWRKPRTLPPIDLQYLQKEVDALRAARNESLLRLASQTPDRSGSQPPLEKLCVPRCVGGSEMVGKVDFQAQWKRGYEAASSKGIVFAGLVRNVDDSVGPLLGLFHAVGKAFARYHTFLIENNSKDDTKEHLRKECVSPHTTCLELDIDAYSRKDQGQGNPSRVRHFTALRQVMLETVKTFIATSTGGATAWDFLVMFDGDFMTFGSRGFHPSAMFALLGFEPDPPSNPTAEGKTNGSRILAEAPWDVICANQLANWPEPGRYRDMFAFRNATWRASYDMVFDRNTYFRGNKLEKVKSCFSGLALYSMRAIIESGCNYTYEDEFECEHVVFHKCLARAGHNRVAIYPPWAVRVNDHGVVTQSCAKLGGPAIDLHEKDLPVYVERRALPPPARKSAKHATRASKRKKTGSSQRRGHSAGTRLYAQPRRVVVKPNAGIRGKAKPRRKNR